MIVSRGAPSNTLASPTSFSARLPTRPPSARQAAVAISGPMPPGSPMVIRMGASADAALSVGRGIGTLARTQRLAGLLDVGVTAQVAQILARQNRHALLEQRLFDVVARGH